jgi:DNA-binding MarR family transcriptional regulator
MARARNKVRHDVSILHLLHRAGLSADELFEFFVGFDGPSSRQHAVLMAVARNTGASQAAIVDATGIDRSTTSEMVPRLVKKGWLQRRRAKDDARAYALRLTAAGRKVIRGSQGAASETDGKMLAPLSTPRRAVLVNALSKIVERYGGA